MQNVEFETDQIPGATNHPAKKEAWMVQMLMKMGVPSAGLANVILLAVAILFFGLTIWLYAGLLGGPKQIPLTPEQMAAQEQVMKQMEGMK